MRVWFINPSFLDSKRLNSQHYESHAIATIIMSGKNWGSMRRLFSESLDFVREVHDNCVKEMLERGKAHSTPFPDIPEEFTSKRFLPTGALIKIDVEHLRSKWEREGYFFGIGRTDLRSLEQVCGLPVGRSPSEALEIQRITRFIIDEHRELYRSIEGRVQDKLAKLFELKPELKDRYGGYARAV